MTPDIEAAIQLLHHRDDCTGAHIEHILGRHNQPMVTCRGCRRYVPLEILLAQLGRTNRRYALDCVRCHLPIDVDRPDPRIPLHTECANLRRHGRRARNNA